MVKIVGCGRLIALALLASGALPDAPSWATAPDWISPAGPGFRIAATNGGGIAAMSSAFDGVNFLTTWVGQNDGIPRARRISPAGALLEPEGFPLAPSTWAPGRPAVAFDGTNYLVVWVTAEQVHGARVTRGGVVLDVPELTLAMDAKPRPISLAFDGTNYLVVWRTTNDAIHATRVTPGGAALDGQFGFMIESAPNDFYPWVAYGGGQYLVAWHGWGLNGLDIFGARVGTNGTVLPPGTFTIFAGLEDQSGASVASNGTDFFVSWIDLRGGNDHNPGSTYGARVSASGLVLDDPPLKVGDYSHEDIRSTALFDGTDYLVAWGMSRSPAKFRLAESVVRRVSPTGALVDPYPIPLGTSTGHQWEPSLAVGGGRYLAVWSEGGSSLCLDGSPECRYGRLFLKTPAPLAPVLPREAPGPPAVGGPEASSPVMAWIPVPVPPPPPGSPPAALHSVWALDANTAYAVGEGPDGYNIPFLRYDGTSWSIWTTFFFGRMFGVWAHTPADIWSVGLCWVMAHFDGAGWGSPVCHGVVSPSGDDPYQMAYGVWSAGPGFDVHTVGTRGSTVRYRPWGLFQSENAGTWADLFDVWGTSADNVYAVGEFGKVLRFNGSAWTPLGVVPTGHALTGVWASGPSDVFVVGDAGTILHYDGAAWSAQASGTPEDLTAVWGRSSSEVYAVGFGGTILRYDGTAWAPEASGTSSVLLDVGGAGNRTWVVGDFSIILTRVALPTVGVASESSTVLEGQGAAAAVAVTVSTFDGTPLPAAVTVAYGTLDGTAQAGAPPAGDYTAVSGTLTFAAGTQPGTPQATQTVSIPIHPDVTDEPGQTFRLVLASPVHAQMATASHLVTIQDDDPPPALSIADAPAVVEGDAGAALTTFAVSLSLASEYPVTVSYATANDGAVAGIDYQVTGGMLSLPPGTTGALVTVAILPDLVHEPTETFFLNLGAPSAATLADGQGLGTIADDDAPGLTIADVAVRERVGATTTVDFTVTLAPTSPGAVTVAYDSADGTATAGSDYQAASGVLAFAPGVSTQPVRVTVNADALREGMETFTINLSGASGAPIAHVTGTARVLDPHQGSDFSSDNLADVLWRHEVSGQNVLWFMNGATLISGTFTTPPSLPDVRWKMVGTNDFNADGKPDILWRHDTSGENVLWYMNGSVLESGTFLTPATLADTRWGMSGTGDFNVDGKPDILWRHAFSGQIVVWSMDGSVLESGTFLTPPSFADMSWQPVGTADFSSPLDGKTDILWRHALSGQNVAWFLEGTVLVSGGFLPTLADTRWRMVALGDYNNDGKPDIVWRHSTSGQNVLWFMDGISLINGSFTNPAALPDPNWKIVGPR